MEALGRVCKENYLDLCRSFNQGKSISAIAEEYEVDPTAVSLGLARFISIDVGRLAKVIKLRDAGALSVKSVS
jgi:hypothetical protein